MDEMPRIDGNLLDRVEEAIQSTLDIMDRQAADLTALFAPTETTASDEMAWRDVLNRLNNNLTGWQKVLQATVETARNAEADLVDQDEAFRKCLESFATARKHLQPGPIRDA